VGRATVLSLPDVFSTIPKEIRCKFGLQPKDQARKTDSFLQFAITRGYKQRLIRYGPGEFFYSWSYFVIVHNRLIPFIL
jgi:hypothetical protein